MIYRNFFFFWFSSFFFCFHARLAVFRVLLTESSRARIAKKRRRKKDNLPPVLIRKESLLSDWPVTRLSLSGARLVRVRVRAGMPRVLKVQPANQGARLVRCPQPVENQRPGLGGVSYCQVLHIP